MTSYLVCGANDVLWRSLNGGVDRLHGEVEEERLGVVDLSALLYDLDGTLHEHCCAVLAHELWSTCIAVCQIKVPVCGMCVVWRGGRVRN